MNFTEEELKKIEEYASLFLNYEEIAILLEKDYGQFLSSIKSKSTDAYKAYKKGKVKTKLELRRKIVKMAMHGSPQAEMLVGKYISDQELYENQ